MRSLSVSSFVSMYETKKFLSSHMIRCNVLPLIWQPASLPYVLHSMYIEHFFAKHNSQWPYKSIRKSKYTVKLAEINIFAVNLTVEFEFNYVKSRRFPVRRNKRGSLKYKIFILCVLGKLVISITNKNKQTAKKPSSQLFYIHTKIKRKNQELDCQIRELNYSRLTNLALYRRPFTHFWENSHLTSSWLRKTFVQIEDHFVHKMGNITALGSSHKYDPIVRKSFWS